MNVTPLKDSSFNLEFKMENLILIMRYGYNSRQREVYARLEKEHPEIPKESYWNELLILAKKVLLQEQEIISLFKKSYNNTYYKKYEDFHVRFMQHLFLRSFDTCEMYRDYLEYFDSANYSDDSKLKELCKKRQVSYTDFTKKYANIDRHEVLRFLYTLRKLNFLGEIQTYVNLGASQETRSFYYDCVQEEKDYYYGTLPPPNPIFLSLKDTESDLDKAQEKLKKLNDEYFKSKKATENWKDEDYGKYVKYLADRDNLNHTISNLKEKEKEQKKNKGNFKQWKQDLKDKEKWKETAFECSKEVTKVALSELGTAIGTLIKGDDKVDWKKVGTDVLKNVGEIATVTLLNALTAGIGGSLIEGLFNGLFPKPDPYMEKFEEIKKQLNKIDKGINRTFSEVKALETFVKESLPTKTAIVVLGLLAKSELVNKLTALNNYIRHIEELTNKRDKVRSITLEDVQKMKQFQDEFISQFEIIIQNGFNKGATLGKTKSSYPRNNAANTFFSKLVERYKVENKTVGFVYLDGIAWFTGQIEDIVIKFFVVNQKVISTLACYTFYTSKTVNRDELILSIGNLTNPMGEGGIRISNDLTASLLVIIREIKNNALDARVLSLIKGEEDIAFEKQGNLQETSFFNPKDKYDRKLEFDKYIYDHQMDYFISKHGSIIKPVLQSTNENKFKITIVGEKKEQFDGIYSIVCRDDFFILRNSDLLSKVSKYEKGVGTFITINTFKRIFIELEDKKLNPYRFFLNIVDYKKIYFVDLDHFYPEDAHSDIFIKEFKIYGKKDKQGKEIDCRPKKYPAMKWRDVRPLIGSSVWEFGIESNDSPYNIIKKSKIWCFLRVEEDLKEESLIISFIQIDTEKDNVSYANKLEIGSFSVKINDRLVG